MAALEQGEARLVLVRLALAPWGQAATAPPSRVVAAVGVAVPPMLVTPMPAAMVERGLPGRILIARTAVAAVGVPGEPTKVPARREMGLPAASMAAVVAAPGRPAVPVPDLVALAPTAFYSSSTRRPAASLPMTCNC